MEFVNSVSDGWPYWSYGTKCAQNLQAIVQEGVHVLRPWGAYRDTKPTATMQDVRKAVRKIQTFVRRCTQLQDKNPPEFSEYVQQVLI